MSGGTLPPAPAAAPCLGCGGTGLRASPVGRWHVPCACPPPPAPPPAAPAPRPLYTIPCEYCSQGIEICACVHDCEVFGV